MDKCSWFLYQEENEGQRYRLSSLLLSLGAELAPASLFPFAADGQQMFPVIANDFLSKVTEPF